MSPSNPSKTLNRRRQARPLRLHLFLPPHLQHFPVVVRVLLVRKTRATGGPVLRQQPPRLVPHPASIAESLRAKRPGPPLRRLGNPAVSAPPLPRRSSAARLRPPGAWRWKRGGGGDRGARRGVRPGRRGGENGPDANPSSGPLRSGLGLNRSRQALRSGRRRGEFSGERIIRQRPSSLSWRVPKSSPATKPRFSGAGVACFSRAASPVPGSFPGGGGGGGGGSSVSENPFEKSRSSSTNKSSPGQPAESPAGAASGSNPPPQPSSIPYRQNRKTLMQN
ncbi:hypothetical protein STAS_11347 [Striga asiatica]|uniref:Uncharacterized protein n=1 Tax=Striga asiatica TaxID=4170 RepID=A0A5A7PQL5_STRAF|nr:hypothetical protein STAS_11347 [Striga asiatica]